jgi:hypothetical protein
MMLELVAATGAGGVVVVGVAEGVEVAVGDGVEVGVELGGTVELGVTVGLEVAVELGGGVEVGVPVELGVAVELGITVALGVTVELGVAVALGNPSPPLPPQPARNPPPSASAIERTTPRCAAVRPHHAPRAGAAVSQAHGPIVSFIFIFLLEKLAGCESCAPGAPTYAHSWSIKSGRMVSRAGRPVKFIRR